MTRKHSAMQPGSQFLPDPTSNNAAEFWHCLQLYENDVSLTNAVAHFIGQGLKAGEALVVIATEGHCRVFEDQLREHGLDVDQAHELGQYVPMDAGETLARFMVNGWPDVARFNEVLGGTIRKVTAAGYPRVRVFGEMVALLWAAGQQGAAIRIEELWTDLTRTHGFPILCAYSIASFSNPAQRESFLKVCSMHSHVLPTESFAALTTDNNRLRAIAQLQQRANSLDAEVTEYKQAQEALRESEARFRHLADTAPVMIWMSGVDKLCTFFNKVWLDFTGRPLEQELGNGWSEGVHAEDFNRCLEVYVHSFDARRAFTMEYRLRRKDGKYRWLLDNGVPRFAPDGSFLGFIGSCVDITDLKETEEALRESQKRYRMATSAGRVGVWDLNLETREIYVDPQLKALLGIREEEIGNHLDDWIGRLHPDDLGSATALAQAHIRGETSFYEFEHRVLHKDGSIRWFLARGRLPRRSEGAVFHMFGTYTEITERKEAELQVERQRNELAHLSRVTMLGTLCSALAHELNQPLMAILSNAQAAQRFLARDSANLNEVRDILKDIVEDNRRASEVIQRLHLLLRKGETQHQPLDLNQVVQDALGLVRNDLVNNRLTAHSELMPELPAICGDRVQLQQVLLNLVMNASTAMADSASAERSLVVRTALLHGETVCVSVQDQGTGIPPENLERIFDPFFTTRAQGMGFGLTICRAII
ncbi:MAG TPA: PAS domain-containing protein, partial [Terriglobia bacterium]|nr:PAS domain-containing protein [Terriglobia bacterium]